MFFSGSLLDALRSCFDASDAFQSVWVAIFLGVAIVVILIVEPHGLARLWQITKQKLRLWPFPY